MGQRSTIDELPDAIREAALAAIGRGASIDAIVDLIRTLGGEVSRSAVGRYAKNYRELAQRTRDMQSVAQAMARDFGEEGDASGRLLVQLVTSMATDAVMRAQDDDAAPPDAETLHFYARAAKDIIGASKANTEREAKVAQLAAERARKEAAAVAETAAKAAGASPEVIQRVKREILGLTA